MAYQDRNRKIQFSDQASTPRPWRSTARNRSIYSAIRAKPDPPAGCSVPQRRFLAVAAHQTRTITFRDETNGHVAVADNGIAETLPVVSRVYRSSRPRAEGSSSNVARSSLHLFVVVHRAIAIRIDASVRQRILRSLCDLAASDAATVIAASVPSPET